MNRAALTAVTGRKRRLDNVSNNYVRLNMKRKGTRCAPKNSNCRYKKRGFYKSRGEYLKKKSSGNDDILERLIDDAVQDSNENVSMNIQEDSDSYESELEIIGDENSGNCTVLDYNSPKSVLKRVFGYNSFQNDQEWAIDRVLNGQSTMLVQATGSGKSLTYLLPSVILPGLTVVISPLISLMEDQLVKLPRELPGACLSGRNGNQAEISKTIMDLQQGRIKILFLSPERLCSPAFQRLVNSTSTRFPAVSLLCLDEAHCLSQWSHNFRPSYLRLRTEVESLNPKCILALTATASRDVVDEVCDTFGIPADGVRIGSWERSNLQITVQHVTCDGEKRLALLELLKSSKYAKRSCIVYVWSQWMAEVLSEFLKSENFKAAAYHAGKSASDRSKIQKQFTNRRLLIVVATIAFGLGIDIAHIRGVIHYEMPQTLESYIQELGRAGRDGKLSNCHLFLNDSDFIARHSLAHSNHLCFVQVYAFLQTVFDIRGKCMNVSVCISALEMKLNMKSEVIETLLTVLEGKKFDLIRIEGVFEDKIQVTFRKHSPEKMSKSNLLISALLKCGKYEESAVGYSHGSITASLLALSSQIGSSPSEVLRQLYFLKKSDELEYETSERSYHLTVQKQATGNLKELARELLNHSMKIESSEVGKVEAIYKALAQVYITPNKANPEGKKSAEEDTDASDAIEKTSESRDDNKNSLIETITKYFMGENPHTFSNIQLPFQEISEKISKEISRSFEVLMLDPSFRGYNSNSDLSGGSVAMPYAWLMKNDEYANVNAARIFHGISSNCYAANLWKDSVFWSRYKNYKFESILEVLESKSNQKMNDEQ